jgi:YD repeat-containing protein
MSLPTSLTDAKGQRTEFQYDDFGRLTTVADDQLR